MLTEKQVLRTELLHKKQRELQTANLADCGRKMLQLFRTLPQAAGLKTAVVFTPLPDEPDVSLINAYLRECGVQVRQVTPSPSAQYPLPFADVDMVVVPVQGFDRSGNRMGRGGGWYDRFLSAVKSERPSVCVVGVCFSFLEVPYIIVDEHDVKMDIILTEKEVIRVG